MNEIEAQDKIRSGEWSVADALAAIETGEVDPGEDMPPIENHQDWDEVEERTGVPPFQILATLGVITYDEQEQLADAMYAARDRKATKDTSEVEEAVNGAQEVAEAESIFQAELALARGERSYEDTLAAIRNGRVNPGQDSLPIPEGATWDQISEDAPQQPFRWVRLEGTITDAQLDELAGAIYEARDRRSSSD